MTDAGACDEPVRSAQERYDSLRNVSAEQPCPYLPDRLARNEAYLADVLDATLYERLLARGFRRSGRVVYRPRCRKCKECRQLRIRTDRFTPSKSLRRVMRRNADLAVDIGEPAATDEKFDIYRRYLESQHDDSMERTYDSFREFLYDSPIGGIEFHYRLGGRLVGISVTDRCPDGLSSVYMYFDPDFAERGLGTFSVLREVEHCRSEDLTFYYLGYYVAGSRTMAYKARFRPSEVLVADDRWMSLPE
jgi:arginyl-tRNA--protein-N-Asp/Glu arginylyltransferase